MDAHSTLAPPFETETWFNAEAPIRLEDLRGRVVLVTVFQMLCPGCVAESLPQARRVHAAFAKADVAVLGLHSVFEHHAAQGPVSLEAFLHENRIGFPVGVDRAAEDGDALPMTMQCYGFKGTPTTLLIDRAGSLRLQTFGHVPDLVLGAHIATLIGQTADAMAATHSGGDRSPVCAA